MDAHWISLARAAHVLDLSPAALRRTLERRARLGSDGTLEAAFDGVRARKFANRWRVHLGTAWATLSARPTHAIRPEKE